MNVKTIKPQTKLVFTRGNLGWSKFNSNCQNGFFKSIFKSNCEKHGKNEKKKNSFHHVSYKISESIVIVSWHCLGVFDHFWKFVSWAHENQHHVMEYNYNWITHVL